MDNEEAKFILRAYRASGADAGDTRGYVTTYDAETGKQLWRFQATGGVNGPPISYAVDGQQYVAVPAGGLTRMLDAGFDLTQLGGFAFNAGDRLLAAGLSRVVAPWEGAPVAARAARGPLPLGLRPEPRSRPSPSRPHRPVPRSRTCQGDCRPATGAVAARPVPGPSRSRSSGRERETAGPGERGIQRWPVQPRR